MHKVKITALSHEGRGIAKLDGKTIFIDNALIGEEVLINITKDKKKYSVAKVIKHITTSNNRRIPPCKYYGLCGGCNIMHMTYAASLDFKKDKLINIFKRYTNEHITPELINSNEFGYRNKITLHSKNNKTGFYKIKSNEIVVIDKCLIADNTLNNNIKQYKEKETILRSNGFEIINNINKKEFIKQINDYKFKLNINSFFQVNDQICKELFKIINENIDGGIILDLYAGVGTLGITASSKAKKVISIENNRYSYENIIENIKLNNIKNMKAILGKTEETIDKFINGVDTIIVDPPRSGLNRKVIEQIKEKNINKLIYISCDPMTLVRDYNLLSEKYKIKKSYILDMFPNTHHIESILILERIS